MKTSAPTQAPAELGNPGAGSAKAPAKAPTPDKSRSKPPRPLVFIDCETTGLDPAKHEILELAAIRVRPRDWQIETVLSLKIRPERIQDADPKALRLNGYDEDAWAWADAVSLAEAMEQLAPVLEGTTIAGHNVAFDRNFLEAAWQSAGHRPTKLDYHLLDTASLAWPLLLSGQIDSVSLAPVCEYLGIDQGEQHRAYNDARASLEVAKRLLSVFSTSVTDSPMVLGSVSSPPIPVETRRQRSPKKPATDQPELMDSRPPPQYRRKDGTPDRRPVRRCRSRHQCDACNTDIVSGEKYLDGGHGRRTHLRCAEPI